MFEKHISVVQRVRFRLMIFGKTDYLLGCSVKLQSNSKQFSGKFSGKLKKLRSPTTVQKISPGNYLIPLPGKLETNCMKTLIRTSFSLTFLEVSNFNLPSPSQCLAITFFQNQLNVFSQPALLLLQLRIYINIYKNNE